MLFFQILFLLFVDIFALVSGLCSESTMATKHVVRIPEFIWRQAASQHENRIRELLQPGLVSFDHPLHGASRKGRRQPDPNEWTALDPINPVYNFLIEYYGLKGLKGPKRLARWSPSIGLLIQKNNQITSIKEFQEASTAYTLDNYSEQGIDGGILLEGATEDDFALSLHLRGAHFVENEGVLYSPSLYFGKNDPSRQDDNARLAAPFLWYQSILMQTLQAEPILHCHGLHEWAMQYHPEGAPPPPSGKYQSHLPLRVSRDVINEAVERRGISCTHVDALRFFAPAASPLNHHGSSLQRMDQLRLEQPGCVHAHMDLLKISAKLRPFCDPVLIQQVLQIALEARRLDVAASPYDATAYGIGVVPIETQEGRAEYRSQQKVLMERAEVVRRDLLLAYQRFLPMAFQESSLQQADRKPQPERFAKAEPGGLPWRKNLTPVPTE
jgi:hypothetical protein